jgi:hypothetical protein
LIMSNIIIIIKIQSVKRDRFFPFGVPHPGFYAIRQSFPWM